MERLEEHVIVWNGLVETLLLDLGLVVDWGLAPRTLTALDYEVLLWHCRTVYGAREPTRDSLHLEMIVVW